MRTEALYLDDILDAADAIARFLRDIEKETFLSDDLCQSAVLQKLTFVDALITQEYNEVMITTITHKNMITVPAEIAQQYGIKPGYRLEWIAVDREQILVRVIPHRRELSRRLLGKGRALSPERDAVAELVEERAREG
ncbi:MAG: hypothetical protein RMK99_07370 [Anaerolineales bacterium]|nr:hypothetical protein [Anaerolineales bacterium]